MPRQMRLTVLFGILWVVTFVVLALYAAQLNLGYGL